MKSKMLAAALCLACLGSAHATESGNLVVKFGAHVVSPKSNNGQLAGNTLKADVGDDIRPTVSLEYFLTPNWGVEVLGALPFKHEVKLNGAHAADVKHLPPTVSVQYHFMPDQSFSPFIGIGLNYTRFFSAKETGPLAGAQLNLSDSWGPAVHVGFDVNLDRNWLLSADVRWIGIETDAKVNGAKVGTVKIDPWVYGVMAGYRF